MLTDVQIAREAKMLPITKVAEGLGIDPEMLELYGKYKAKLSDEVEKAYADRPNGKPPGIHGKTVHIHDIPYADITHRHRGFFRHDLFRNPD